MTMSLDSSVFSIKAITCVVAEQPLMVTFERKGATPINFQLEAEIST